MISTPACVLLLHSGAVAPLSAIPAEAPPGPQPAASFTTLPFATSLFVLEDGVALVVADEWAGAGDLNGDGDELDRVLQVAYGPGQLVNTGVSVSLPAIGPEQSLQVSGGRAWFEVKEQDEGVDLNGDGALGGRVLHRLDLATGRVESSGVSTGGFAAGELAAVFLAAEGQQGVDWNGDGDVSDQVVHLWPPGQPPVDLGLAVGPSPSYGIDGPFVRVGVFEWQQGLSDLNGDGDALDQDVLHLGVGGALGNTGLQVKGGSFVGDWLVHSLSEEEQGVDLSGDGDTEDDVLFATHGPTAVSANLGIAVDGYRVAGQHLVLGIPEADLGADANGDGDLGDTVLRVLDLATGGVVTLPLATTYFDVAEAGVFLHVSEAGQGGADLDGDGDADGEVPFAYAYGTGDLTLLPDWVHAEAGPADLVMLVAEDAAEADLNGDGDRTDEIVHHFSFATGAVHDLGLAVELSTLEPWPEHALLLVSEQAQGGQDLNGDGSPTGNCVFVYEYATGELTNLQVGQTSVEPAAAQIDGDVLAIRVQEKWVGGDASGDGDDDDFVLAFTKL